MGRNGDEPELTQKQLRKLVDTAVERGDQTLDEDIKTILLQLKCPRCRQRLESTGAYIYSGETVERRCWKCRAQWTITIRPYRIPGDIGFAYELEWERK